MFTGEGTGYFSAFDADTGDLLWRAQTESGVKPQPVTYEINGVQYVAVAAGGNQLYGFRQGDTLQVYAWPRKRRVLR